MASRFSSNGHLFVEFDRRSGLTTSPRPLAEFPAPAELREAANRVSPRFREAHADIPWSEIVGMRHKIVHDYLGVDHDIVCGRL